MKSLLTKYYMQLVGFQIVKNIGLEDLDIKTGLKGEIIVDKYSKT